MVRRISNQDGTHQYDYDGNVITTWDERRCCWIVNPEFEKDEIDWYGDDSDFPSGCTIEEFKRNNPDFDNNPEVVVIWYWNDKETCIKAFGEPHTFQHKSAYNPRYWEEMKYPFVHTKTITWMDIPESEAVETLGKYADFNKFASRVVVKYNGKILHDGVLK